MKISLIGPVHPYRGGIVHYTTSLAIALKKAGHDIDIFSFKRQYPAFLYPGETDKDPSANPIRVDAEYVLDPIYLWTCWQTARLILQAKPNLVLFQWWTTFWGPAFSVLSYLLRNKVPIAYLIHNVLPHENRVWDRWLARIALGWASAFIVQTAKEQRRLLDLIPSARTRYCRHPVYQRFGEQIISKKTARQHLGLPIDNPVFLFFGIVRPYKGLRILIEAMSKTDPACHLIVAGEFWENVEVYKNLINDLGLNKRITLLDKYLPNEEAHLVFSSADALVAPYVGGTQSGVVELAHGYGLPVVMTDIIANDFQDNLATMRIVPACNADALAAAITDLTALPTIKDLFTAPDVDDWNRMVKTIEGI